MTKTPKTKRAVGVVALVMAATSVIVPSLPASAASCGNEEQVFVRTPITTEWEGTTGWVAVYNSSLASCTGVWSVRTIHQTDNANPINDAEAGWRKDLNGGGGSAEWFSFTESMVGDMGCGTNSYYTATTNDVGGTINYKVNGVSGTTSWDFFADFGSGYVSLPVNGSGGTRCDNVFSAGRSEGETSVKGNTNAHTSSSSLLRKSCSGGTCSWNSWNSTHSDGGNIPNWYPNCYASNAYTVILTNNNNCPY